jgi:hypothetical protein
MNGRRARQCTFEPVSDLDTFFTYGFPLLFIGTWFTVARVLKPPAGMTRQLDVATGELIRASRWGTASINGFTARRCAKLEEYREGYVVGMMWLFGGGRLWLPKRGLQLSELRPGNFWGRPRSRVLISGMNQIILYDTLTEFVASQ